MVAKQKFLDALYECGLLQRRNSLPLFWWRGSVKTNFGDIVGPYLADAISGMRVQHVNPNHIRSHYLTVGSILAFANHKSIIWGSGILSMTHKITHPRKICAVRGPKTRERLMSLGIDCPEVYGDPALLLPRYCASGAKKEYRLGIIPHFVDFERIDVQLRNEPGVRIVNLLAPLRQIVDDINSCERTLSSSLHGLIVSHAYGIPSAWAEFSDKLAGDGVKFDDYFLSVNLPPYKPYDYIDKTIRAEEVIAIIDRYHQQQIEIDLSKLMEACPFGRFSNRV